MVQTLETVLTVSLKVQYIKVFEFWENDFFKKKTEEGITYLNGSSSLHSLPSVMIINLPQVLRTYDKIFYHHLA